MNARLTITELAVKIGITPQTIVRWETAGNI
ncbi:MAG: helix-turn-helix transcriptional regulator, partial [Bacteroidetes bacterium]|nr:helix-turn-helix transcriptional regulator [Bacteroidota bacterium]